MPDREKQASGRTEGLSPVYNLPQMVQECWRSLCTQTKNPWTKRLMLIAPSKGQDRTGQDRTGECVCARVHVCVCVLMGACAGFQTR